MPAFDEAFANMFRAAGEAQQRGAEIADRKKRRAWEEEDRAARAAKQSKIDEAFSRMRGLSTTGVVEQGAGDLTAGGIQQVMDSGYGGTTGVAAAQELGVDSYREAQRGLRAPAAAPDSAAQSVGLAQNGPQLGLAQNGPRTRAARKSEIYGALMDVATHREDAGGYAAALTQREGALDDELIAGVKLPKIGTPEFSAMTDSLVTKLNAEHKTVTFGEPDKNGMRQVAIVTKTGKALFETLSSAEQLKLAQANALMERNPTRAMQMIESVNKNLAEAIARENGLTLNVGKEGNDAAYRGGMMDATRTHQDRMFANDSARLGLARREADARAAAAERANWVPETYTDKDGNIVVMDVNRSGKTPQFKQRDMPAGLKPYNPRERGGPQKIEPEGTAMMHPEYGYVLTDGMGGFVDGKHGVMPAERGKLLTSAGVPVGAVEQLQWSETGDAVVFGGKAYLARDPQDMRTLAAEVRRLARNTKLVDEDSRRNYHGAPQGLPEPATRQPTQRLPF